MGIIQGNGYHPAKVPGELFVRLTTYLPDDELMCTNHIYVEGSE